MQNTYRYHERPALRLSPRSRCHCIPLHRRVVGPPQFPTTLTICSLNQQSLNAKMKQFDEIWPASLDRWNEDEIDGTLYSTFQQPYQDEKPEVHYSFLDPDNRAMTITLGATPIHFPYIYDHTTAERYIIMSLDEELNSHKMPVITE